MRVKAAAGFFNHTVCLDAYDGTTLFYAQIGLYDDTKRDSEASERRVFSCVPGITLPARGVVEAAGTHWIIGHGNVDTFKGDVIRVGYVAHEAPDLSKIQTLDQFCTNTTGVSAYAGRAWVKDLAFSEQSSVLAGQHHIHFSQTESVAVGNIVTYNNLPHVVRITNLGPAGTLIVTAEQMPAGAVETGSFAAGTWNPVTEAWTGTPVSARVVRMRWQSLFKYLHAEAPTFAPGDIQLAVSKSVLTPVPGQTVTLSDGVWRLASVLDEGVWLCRAVRNG